MGDKRAAPVTNADLDALIATFTITITAMNTNVTAQMGDFCALLEGRNNNYNNRNRGGEHNVIGLHMVLVELLTILNLNPNPKKKLCNLNNKMSMEELLDWFFEVERFFNLIDVPENKQVKMVSRKLKNDAAYWWYQSHIWIQNVLQSARLSVSVNGTPCGFFNCSRGVRQGDPLSPLLFCPAEEVLSRGLGDLVSRGKIKSIAAPKKLQPPSNVLYADDVMIFMQGNSRGLRALNRFLQEYAANSGQVYHWPRELLKKVQGWMRNFYWSRDPLKKGAALVAWKNCCLPKDCGGLGLKNIFTLNRSLLLKRCWEMIVCLDRSAAIMVCIIIKLEMADRVGDYIVQNQWVLPLEFLENFPEASNDIMKIDIPEAVLEDTVIWPTTSSGSLTAAEAYTFLSDLNAPLEWGKAIWHKALQPRKSIVCWKVFHHKILVDEIMQRRVPVYSLLGVSPLRAKAPKFIPVVWEAPPSGWIKVNTDGSFSGTTRASFGGVFRDSEGLFLGGFSYNATVPSAIDAEVLAIIEAINVALVRRWTHIWLETNSILALRYFKNPGLIPWRLRTSWLNCLHKVSQITFRMTHIFREGNALADKFARYGASNVGAVWWRTLPSSFLAEFGRDLSSRINYRFS
ncbi:uncharacterized protein LOC133723132 [Rosa rugosa]|uniref:uncharacterized protein LOC133723132 n=1 Tax=Rosa rugosa TaxID=74645 RepID=UPI002B410B3B|nr:uncharacterized protein LOC133723132 [Rosa rugosa]